ncbi:MAG: hypothetical protein ABI418_13615 [Jatrophihabitantaceae bacterium]
MLQSHPAIASAPGLTHILPTRNGSVRGPGAPLPLVKPHTASTTTSEPPCKSPTTRYLPKIGNVTVYYCPIWTQAGVWDMEGQSNYPGGDAPIGYLNSTGYANWFVCGIFSRYMQNWYALTEADNGQWGMVSGYYYAGTSNYWPNPLPGCTGTEMSKYGEGWQGQYEWSTYFANYAPNPWEHFYND